MLRALGQAVNVEADALGAAEYSTMVPASKERNCCTER